MNTLINTWVGRVKKVDSRELALDISIPKTAIKKDKINRIIHQIWIGPLPPPTKWMKTWQKLNPNWKYVVWDNDKVFNRKWRNQHLIDECLRRYKENGDVFTTSAGYKKTGEAATLYAWHLIADLLRYEILYEYGGYMPGADSVCLKSIDDKFPENCELYTVNTGYIYTKQRAELEAKLKSNEELTDHEKVLFDRYAPDNASPILACQKGNEFVKNCIEELHLLKPQDIGDAVDTTGNVFIGKMINKYKPKITLNPYLMQNYDGERYSIHWSGTTKGTYEKGR